MRIEGNRRISQRNSLNYNSRPTLSAIEVGAKVCVERLANASHNGKKGTIIKTKKSPGEGRVAVRLDDGKTVLLVKLENLEEEWPALPSPSKHSFCALNDCFDDSNADPEEEEAISELVQDESQGKTKLSVLGLESRARRRIGRG